MIDTNKNYNVFMKKLISLLLLVSILLCAVACTNQTETKKKFSSVDQIDGSVVGVMSGSVFDEIAAASFPNSEILYFSDNGDLVQALYDGRIDACVNDDIQAIQICKEDNNLAFFTQSLKDFDYGFVFPKTAEGKALRDDFNIFLGEIVRDGTIDEIVDRWSTSSDMVLDFSLLTGVNGTLTMATDSTGHPMTYCVNGQYGGIDVEIAYLYCLNRGYKLQIDDYSFGNIIPAVNSSKADFAGAGIIITSERQQSVYFSNTYYTTGCLATVLRERYEKVPESVADFTGKKIAVMTGSIGEKLVKENIKDPTIVPFDTLSDMVTALKNGKVDAIAQSEISLIPLIEENSSIKIVCPIYIENWAFAFPKTDESEELRSQMNEFIHKHSETNELQTWYNEWIDADTLKVVDYDSLSGDRTLEVAVCSSVGQPNCYYVGDKLTGYEIDIYTRFAQEYGYKLNFTDYNYGGMIVAIGSGKTDIGGISIAVTDERKESVYFSDIYLSGYFDIAYYDQNNIENEATFIEKITASFEKTFIKEDRYKLFISGFASTALITLLSTVAGSVLGMLLFLIFRRNNVIFNTLLKAYAWLINGTPTVVLLMVFFYIIFTGEMFTSTIVSIISFTVIFSIKTLGLLQTCFATIDKGQYDAAYALGYGKTETFFKIICPQVAPIFLPSFSGEVVSLLKSTSVVGYIAVQDLTKMSDIIRSRTYESFFPLISTTIIYFVIAWLLTTIIKYLINKIDPRKRKEKDIFKGVVRHD